MTWIGCEETMGWLSRAFAEPAVQQQLRELRAARAEPGAYISALAEVAGDAQRDTLIAEFRQLPRSRSRRSSKHGRWRTARAGRSR
ncbi:MAG: hypothetical protein IPG47_10385 [Thermoflexaceae bacterium]|nr:hypothetical protein [Thermoflexaceae bacterium]